MKNNYSSLEMTSLRAPHKIDEASKLDVSISNRESSSEMPICSKVEPPIYNVRDDVYQTHFYAFSPQAFENIVALLSPPLRHGL